MRFGCCITADGPDGGARGAATLARLGYDFAEFQLVQLMAMGEPEFDALAKEMERAPVKCENCNVALPGSLKLTGPDVREGEQRDYWRRAVARASRLGVRCIGVGASGSRTVPDGFPLERAREQFVAFMRMSAEIADVHGVAVAIEPLNRGETNFILSTAEAVELAHQAARPAAGMMVDYYHFAVENEDFSAVGKAGAFIRHAHAANPNGRVFPAPGDGADYRGFIHALRSAGYDGNLSVEASCADFERDAAAALTALKEAANQDADGRM